MQKIHSRAQSETFKFPVYKKEPNHKPIIQTSLRPILKSISIKKKGGKKQKHTEFSL